MKATGFNDLIVHPFQATGFKCENLHPYIAAAQEKKTPLEKMSTQEKLTLAEVRRCKSTSA